MFGFEVMVVFYVPFLMGLVFFCHPSLLTTTTTTTGGASGLGPEDHPHPQPHHDKQDDGFRGFRNLLFYVLPYLVGSGQSLIATALYGVWALPRSKYHLPALVYGSVLLHQQQRRSGRTHRKVILACKIYVFLVAALALYGVWSIPGVLRQNLADDAEKEEGGGGGGQGGGGHVVTPPPHLGGTPHRLRTVADYYYYYYYYALVATYEVVGILWAYAATPVLAYVAAMDFCLCFAWSPVPDVFTIAELRAMAMARAEEGRRRGIMDDGGSAVVDDEDDDEDEEKDGEGGYASRTMALLERVRMALADWGEGMAGFAMRQW
ncbi:hypothetical protein F4778DRAFT_410942 [Xylariomycetidae sp. FL2044]|nr:hypothetical protein F4778DRAFT_410942 [Xylariomycetidae sp. FL2044]